MFIILTVFKSQRRITSNGESNTSLNRESTLARRVFAIILTDFSCWVPVVILSILALFGKFKDPDGTVYVWFAVFVLPINSSVNPVLYTFSTPKVLVKHPQSWVLKSLGSRWHCNYLDVGRAAQLSEVPRESNLSIKTTTLINTLDMKTRQPAVPFKEVIFFVMKTVLSCRALWFRVVPYKSVILVEQKVCESGDVTVVGQSQ